MRKWSMNEEDEFIEDKHEKYLEIKTEIDKAKQQKMEKINDVLIGVFGFKHKNNKKQVLESLFCYLSFSKKLVCPNRRWWAY
ncbi:hypothetical protein MHBO_005305 [Bonamia ostreae]|uniref:Uncharacterized protein n=1 Tax=Bonamia ostreae TaxID=126728 RepID=A0ABV2ALA3_9EUKA